MTRQQHDYILAHINDRPRAKVAKAAGVSMTTVYRIVRENGGELRHDLSTKREGIEATVRKYYPDMTASEIAERFGYSRTRVNVWAYRLGVRHSAETEARIKAEYNERMAESKKRIDQQAKAARWRRKRRMDELRVLSGMPQKTRFRFATLPVQAQQTIWRMVKKRNYFQLDDEPRTTLFYDNETRRVRTEERLAKKYGLRFVAADGEDGTDDME